MSMGDYVIDRDLAEMDLEESRQERRQVYVGKRSREIEEARMSKLSRADFILALEIISTMPIQVDRLQEMAYANDEYLATELRGMVHAAIIEDSIDIAITEFKAMEAEPPSCERH